MKPENSIRLAKLHSRIEDTIDGDWDGDDGYTCTVSITYADMQELANVMADEVGIRIDNPLSDDAFHCLFQAVHTAERDDLWALWDIIDGWEPGTRNAAVLDCLPTVYTDKSVIEEVSNG